ncbi:hypothetical protein K3495_g1022 [Podosphaera aphanis]|nr:hypothetical protein K3495_g1022 [Podosphaera aphanis]
MNCKDLADSIIPGTDVILPGFSNSDDTLISITHPASVKGSLNRFEPPSTRESKSWSYREEYPLIAKSHKSEKPTSHVGADFTGIP